MKHTLFIFFLLALSGIAFSQSTQVSEQDVQTESVFIEAIRNKLIDRHDLSVPQFRELLKKQPDNDVLWYELGFGLLKTKKIEEALDAVSKAISISPRNIMYLQLQADILHAKQDYLSEINVFKKLQSLAPFRESYYTRWVDLLITSSRWEEAIRVLNLLEQVKGVNEISSLKKAALFELHGKSKEAESELLHLNAAFPGDIKYMHALAGFYIKNQKTAKANAIYKDILFINANDEKANLALATQYRNNGQDDQYLQSLNSLMENDAISLDAKIIELIPYLQKAIARQDKALLETIEKYASNLNSTYPNEAKTHALYADVLAVEERNALAYTHYLEAIRLNPSIKTVWIQYLLRARQFEEPAQFVQSAEHAFDLFPNDPGLSVTYCYALIKNGDLAEAESILKQSLLMAANNSVLLEAIYSLQLSMDYLAGRIDQVKEQISKLKSINSKSFLSVIYPIELLTAQGKQLELASDLTVQALKDQPQQPELLGYLGIIKYKLKKYNEAKTSFESAIHQNTQFRASFFESYGDTLFMLKDLDGAWSAWKKAAELNPFNIRLKKKVLDKTLE